MQASGESGTGRQCAAHPDKPAVVTCSRCGDFACVDCYDVSRQGDDLCATCMAAVAQHIASRADRLFAYLINAAVAMVVMLFPILLLFLGDGLDVAGPDRATVLMGLMGVALMVLGGINVYLLATRGQSVGKVVMKIRIVADDGTPAGLFTILILRLFIPQLLSSLCSLFGILDALAIFREDSRCIHDHIASTIVVKVNPEEPSGF